MPKEFVKGETVWWVDPIEYLCNECVYVGLGQSQGEPAHHIELTGYKRALTVNDEKLFNNKAAALHKLICLLGNRISTIDMQVVRIRREQRPIRSKWYRACTELTELTGGRDV